MLGKLNQREKFLLLVSSVFVFLVLVFYTFRFVSKKREEYREEIQKSKKELQTLLRLKDSIANIPKISNIPDKNQFLELVSQKLQELALTPNSIRDREEKIGKDDARMIIIELSFNGISLDKLFRFLYEMEYNQRGIKVREILIRKPLPGRDIFDVRLSLYVQKY
ncbi:MAG: type II secretion system protein GspM [Leptonema sp. (in: bacteria)]